ncbi:hypothetical protein HanXRQr2_Chr03g0116061 [Helianthus annuus]|uniref:Uncharacterized protein n=1 Tax=Helianthus annuus TaxID=4232 RepID=A0A9K3JH43_HELAN|nr:hypothetical protein HanXRQr2_Chr03g0116061 [Helianthus annuus]KAJ0944113.1 hypothetical protein HanPSC8_Chr03g0112481 [Helianthus annuus]
MFVIPFSARSKADTIDKLAPRLCPVMTMLRSSFLYFSTSWLILDNTCVLALTFVKDEFGSSEVYIVNQPRITFGMVSSSSLSLSLLLLPPSLVSVVVGVNALGRKSGSADVLLAPRTSTHSKSRLVPLHAM